MKKKYLFIVNPIAGGGRGKRFLPHLKDTLFNNSAHAEIAVTERKGHASEIAYLNKNNYNIFVSVGGDGTLNEVINGIGAEHDRTTTAIGLIPVGSGNDFSKALEYNGTVHDILEFIIHDGSVVKMDMGEASYRESGKSEFSNRLFINGLGIGFDALVAHMMKRYKIINGLPAYMLPVLKSLIYYKNIPVKGRIEKADGSRLEIDDKHFLIALGNGKYSGGGFNLNPGAQPHDGLLDACFVRGLKIQDVFTKIPKAIKGTHGDIPEVSLLRFKEAKLELLTPYFVHIDGDIISTQVAELNVKLSAKINFLQRRK